MTEVTIRDVAHRANLSLGTVSNYLTERKPVSKASRSRIEAAIQELGYVPNTAVRVMRGGRSHAVAFLVPEAANPFFSEVARGIEDVAVERGHAVMVCSTEGDSGRERQYSKVLSEMRVRAVVVFPSVASKELVATLRHSGARVILLGSSGGRGLSSVTVDDVRGGALAMAHLLELGHRRIAYFGGPRAELQIADRLRGARSMLKKYGLADDLLVRVDTTGTAQAQRLASAREVLAHPFRPTAVMCANDVLALALEVEAVRSGLQVPSDVSLVGYDDIEAAETALVPLTSVHQPHYELGRTAGELAFAESDEGRHVVLKPTLVVRESTGAAREDLRSSQIGV